MVMKYTIQRNLFRFTEITSRAPPPVSCSKTLQQKFIFQIGTLNSHGINERFSFN